MRLLIWGEISSKINIQHLSKYSTLPKDLQQLNIKHYQKRSMNFLKKEILTAYSRMNPRIRIERKMREQLFFQRKMIMDDHLLHLKESGVTSHRYGDADIIVSLTTYGRRIHSVYATIESLMEQTMKANRIILWLDTSFQGKPLLEHRDAQAAGVGGGFL